MVYHTFILVSKSGKELGKAQLVDSRTSGDILEVVAADDRLGSQKLELILTMERIKYNEKNYTWSWQPWRVGQDANEFVGWFLEQQVPPYPKGHSVYEKKTAEGRVIVKVEALPPTPRKEPNVDLPSNEMPLI